MEDDHPAGRPNELTRPQQGAVAKVDNIIGNGAKEHNFDGVAKELRGETTGFDHVTEMRNNVAGCALPSALSGEALQTRT